MRTMRWMVAPTSRCGVAASIARAQLRNWRSISDLSARSSGSASSATSTADASSQLVPAVCAFVHIHKHFAVPLRFQVPVDSDDAWPQELHGVRLGTMISRFVRARHQDPAILAQLKEVGFPVEVRNWKQFVWESVPLAALQVFQDVHSHLLVPQAFVVPIGDDLWPRATWGFKLGNAVNSIRRQHERGQLESYQTQSLEAIGFEWNAYDARWRKFFLPALRRFHDINGHACVPQAFVVPSDDPAWPREIWNYALGETVMSVRAGIHEERVREFKDELERLGFTFDPEETKWETRILPALETFASVYGHCRVPQTFVVPDISDQSEEEIATTAIWPEATRGLRLGILVNSIRSRKQFADQVARDRARLQASGFVWSVADAKWHDQFMPALRRYYDLHRTSDVPSTFVVPREDSQWPEALWGFALGQMVRVVRRGGYLEYVNEAAEELQALGFSFNAMEGKWSDRILPSIETFYAVHGHCRIPKPFVVPSSSPWPSKTWGLKLGNIVSHIHYGGGYVEYVEAHRAHLDKLGFFRKESDPDQQQKKKATAP